MSHPLLPVGGVFVAGGPQAASKARPRQLLGSVRRAELAAQLPDWARLLLERLVRLRVLTPPTARLLTPALSGRTQRNAYQRLRQLVRDGWLAVDAVFPQRGAVTPHYYRPSYKALRHLGIEGQTDLLRRPVQHVLEWLLFRADIYARALAADWYLGSPNFLAPKNHSAALARFSEFLQARTLERYRLAQSQRAPAHTLLTLHAELQQLPAFLPTTLDFEFLYRVDEQSRVRELVLLLLDDVRRGVPAQVAALPLVAKSHCGVLIRDSESVYDPLTAKLAHSSERYRALAAAVATRFGDPLPSTDTVLPDVWGRTVRPQNPAAQRSTNR